MEKHINYQTSKHGHQVNKESIYSCTVL